MPTRFTKLNVGWNAEPNAPDPQIALRSGALVLNFLANPFQFPEFSEGERLSLRFSNPWRWRLGDINDEGWHRGQCRFSSIAPSWGEFYGVSGDLLLQSCPDDWHYASPEQPPQTSHYLFYLRDETFECDAKGWRLERDAA